MKSEPASSPSRTGFLWWVLRAQWAWGFLSLTFLTEVSRPAVFSATAAFLAGTVLDRSARQRDGWRRLGAPLALLAFGAAAADLFLGSQDLLFSASILVLGIQSIKFLLPKNSRDGWQLSTVSFLEFVAAAAATVEIQFAAFAFLFLGLCAGAMWALQIERRGEEGDEAARLAHPRFAAKLLLLSAAAGILMAGILFAVTPRIGIGQILRRLGRSEGLTGFSDTISLREVTGIKADRRVVARVEFPELPPGVSPAGLYLRGATYSRFTGTAWIRPERYRFRVPRSGFHYFVASPPPKTRLATAEISLEAMDNPALFVYGEPCLFEGSLGEVWTEGRGSFSIELPAHPALRYRLQFSPDARRGALPGPPDSIDYLRLPPGHDDIRKLAGRVTAGGKTDAERAELALRHFRAGFLYTVVDPASSIREFLFDKRAGFCEHYASALALLLRAAGIPSRVAAGYLGGEWSDVGKYLIVRQSDAHAWTEGWIGGRWVTLDATPFLGEHSPFYSRTGTPGIYLDWARQRWNKYVVNYSLKMQGEGVAGGWAALGRARAGIGNAFAAGKDLRLRAGRLAALLLALIACMVLLMRFLCCAGREGESAARKKNAILPPRPYARLIRRLAAAGYRGSPGATVEEMVLGAMTGRPTLAPDALRFLALYHRERFAARPLSPSEFRESARLADRIGREIRRPVAGAR
jgi:transglutaminase-like putative cysteine protease